MRLCESHPSANIAEKPQVYCPDPLGHTKPSMLIQEQTHHVNPFKLYNVDALNGTEPWNLWNIRFWPVSSSRYITVDPSGEKPLPNHAKSTWKKSTNPNGRKTDPVDPFPHQLQTQGKGFGPLFYYFSTGFPRQSAGSLRPWSVAFARHRNSLITCTSKSVLVG